jgi:hypothetical protein
VTVYAAGASGNVAPIRTIRGSKTALFPRGIAVHEVQVSAVTGSGAGASRSRTLSCIVKRAMRRPRG